MLAFMSGNQLSFLNEQDMTLIITSNSEASNTLLGDCKYIFTEDDTTSILSKAIPMTIKKDGITLKTLHSILLNKEQKKTLTEPEMMVDIFCNLTQESERITQLPSKVRTHLSYLYSIKNSILTPVMHPNRKR